MKKIGEKEVARILGKNQVPEADRGRIAALQALVRREAERSDFMGMTESSFFYRLLRQLPYITKWVWLAQALVMVFFMLCGVWTEEGFQMIVFLSFTGPALALLPGVDMVRSYGCNMWEMEAACRYDLRQIMTMRMCIVGGTDLVVLMAGCLLYGRQKGNIWEFGLFVLLPFFVNCSVYLWEINRFAGRCSSLMLGATGLGLTCAGVPLLLHIHERMAQEILEWAPVFTGWALTAVCILTICLCFRLWNGFQVRKGEAPQSC